MLLNEIINEVGMTKRAVKYYEEKGLLSVDKDSNGYRNYSAQDVETLKKISVYRKLGSCHYNFNTHRLPATGQNDLPPVGVSKRTPD